MDSFAKLLLRWYNQHGRSDLPWQTDKSPYRVWVSEIMLQQTQVATVIPYFERFTQRFPTTQALAAANLDEVLHLWTGLGYYARGRNLHKAARIIVNEAAGALPAGVDALCQLPGIGRSTAGAISAIAQGIRAPILDGNVKRVLARFHAVAGYPGDSKTAKTLWAHAEAHTPRKDFGDYTQAIMDLGATLCTRGNPGCGNCPLKRNCRALSRDEVDRYPGKKPGKAKPVRAARMFVIHDGARSCLVEQRAASGVWGGLWTPPQRAPETSPIEVCTEFAINPRSIVSEHAAPAFRHTFTHFHLDIEPIYIEVTTQPAVIRDTENLRWLTAGMNEPLGLPAPAVKLLKSLVEDTLT